MKRYGLIGFPLGHSFSGTYFNEKFRREGIHARYDLFELKDIAEFQSLKLIDDLCGLNVTIPYKQQVIPYLDEKDETAAEIGAVNVIKFIRSEGSLVLKGFNSDVIGFSNSIKPFLKQNHKKAFILGTGGASKALKYVLKKLGIAFISASIEELKENEIRYEDIDEKVISERRLIINATPLGTYPKVEGCPNIPYQFLTNDHLLFDLVYNPEVTRFMSLGLEKGATVKNGYEMLLLQAERSYAIWNEE